MSDAEEIPIRINDKKIRFFAVGCHGTGDKTQDLVAQYMSESFSQTTAENGASKLDFCMLLGDNFYDQGVSNVDDPLFDRCFLRPFTGIIEKKIKFYSILGNHDYGNSVTKFHPKNWGRGGNPDAQIEFTTSPKNKNDAWQMPGHYYLLNCYTNTRFSDYIQKIPLLSIFCIDTETYMVNRPKFNEQLDWLSKNLNSSKSKYKILACHHPIKTSGSHCGEEDIINISNVLIQKDIKFDIILSAHEHNSQLHRLPSRNPNKSGNSIQVIAGAGGRVIHPFNGLHSSSMIFGDDHGYGFVSIEADDSDLEIKFYLFHENTFEKSKSLDGQIKLCRTFKLSDISKIHKTNNSVKTKAEEFQIEKINKEITSIFSQSKALQLESRIQKKYYDFFIENYKKFNDKIQNYSTDQMRDAYLMLAIIHFRMCKIIIDEYLSQGTYYANFNIAFNELGDKLKDLFIILLAKADAKSAATEQRFFQGHLIELLRDEFGKKHGNKIFGVIVSYSQEQPSDEIDFSRLDEVCRLFYYEETTALIKKLRFKSIH